MTIKLRNTYGMLETEYFPMRFIPIVGYVPGPGVDDLLAISIGSKG